MLAFGSQLHHLHGDPFSMGSEPYSSHGMTTSYNEHPEFVTAPLQYCDTSPFFLHAPHDDSQHMYYQPAPSGYQHKIPTEQPPSSLSTASGPSVPSASSSTIGSPYSSHAHPNSYPESWGNVTQGLGLDPAIASGEDFNQEFSATDIDQAPDFAPQTKVSANFVGESSDFSSVSKAQSTVSSNSFLSPPSLAIKTALDESSLTIDSILEKANSAVSSPNHFPTPISGRPITSSPTTLKQQPTYPSRDTDVFKTPTTPASVARSVGRQSPCSEHKIPRAPTRTATTPLRTLSQQPFSPGATPQAKSYPSPNAFHGHFFSHSINSLIPPSTSTYPSLITGPRPPFMDPCGPYSTESGYPPIPASTYPHPSPAPSPTPSNHDLAFQTYPPPQMPGMPYYPFPNQAMYRKNSISSLNSRPSPHSPLSNSIELDDESQKGRCPHPDCGRIFKDLKAHMLTHQSERPEKCPIANCEYNQKGFARKYDKNRHTLTHYKGTMVCGFCPGSGSAAEKSFNRADVFKRHLTSVHGVEQTPPNSRKRSPTATAKKITSYCQDATGKCSTCSQTFNNAQDFYEHLDDCVLRVVQQEEPSEAINQQHLATISKDDAVKDTMERHMLTNSNDVDIQDDEDDEDDDDEDDDPTYSNNGRSGKGSIKANKAAGATSRAIISHDNSISKPGKPQRKGLTLSKGGVSLVGKGRKKRKHYPPSWGVSADKMKMKKRVLCVYDGPRRLWKDDMMLNNEFEVRMKLADGKSYVTDLDVESLKRAEGLHGATEDEKGPWTDEGEALDLEALMS